MIQNRLNTYLMMILVGAFFLAVPIPWLRKDIL